MHASMLRATSSECQSASSCAVMGLEAPPICLLPPGYALAPVEQGWRPGPCMPAEITSTQRYKTVPCPALHTTHSWLPLCSARHGVWADLTFYGKPGRCGSSGYVQGAAPAPQQRQPDAGAQASLQSRASMVSRESTVDTTNPLAWRTAAASSRRRGPRRTAARGRRSTRPARTAAAGSRRATGRRPTAPARPTARQACRARGAAAASPTAPRAGPSAPWQTCTSDQAQLSSVALRCKHVLACALVPCRNVTSQGAGRRPQRCVRSAPPMPVPAANVQVGAR